MSTRPGFILIVLLSSLSRLVASDPLVPDSIKGFMVQAEAAQARLINGREYVFESAAEFMDGTKKGYLYKVKKYDDLNWIIANKNMIFGSNDRYMFAVEKNTNNTWRKLSVLSTNGEDGGEILGRREFDALFPLTALEGRSIGLIGKETGYENAKFIKGDINELAFESKEKARRSDVLMFAISKIVFRENPTKNFSYIERLYKGDRGDNILTSTRNYTLSSSEEIEINNVDTVLRRVQTDEVLQKETHKYTNFQKTKRMDDNFLTFYGLSEPSNHFYSGKPWWSSFWFLGGTGFVLLGGMGFWLFRSRG